MSIKEVKGQTLESYYRNNRQRHVNALRKKISPPCQAEDIVQEAFIKALNNIDKFDEEKGNLNNWFSKILYRTFIDYTRICSKEPISVSTEDYVDYNIISENISTIRSCIKATEEKHKKLLNLFYIKGYSVSEIHSILHISETVIKQTCYKFRNTLKKEWGLEV